MHKTLFALALLLSVSFFAQKKKSNLNEKIVLVIKEQPKTYKEINYHLRFFKRDTSSLKKMITSFKESNYLYGKTYAENQLGIKYRRFSQYQKAIVTHEKALKTANK